MDEKIPTWGYARGEKAEIFQLSPGEKLPDGYFAHPAMIRGSAAEKQMKADAEREGAPFQFEPENKKP